MIAIIPARGGSKGLSGKNIKNLCGRPLIDYTIRATQKSQSVDRVIVSTDSEEIASVAKECGAEVPFMRPGRLSGDDAKAVDAYLYTADQLETRERIKIESLIVLQPTSPFRTCDDIDQAIRIFKDKKADSVISITELDHPLEWSRRIDGKGILRHYFDHEFDELANRHENKVVYRPNGAIFIFDVMFLKREMKYHSDRTYPYIMPRERSVDIDNVHDFKIAEVLMSERILT